MIAANLPKYGLKKDGTGDCAPGFKQIVVDAIAKGENIYLEEGTYRSTSFQLGSGVSFLGANRMNTKILAHPSLEGNQSLLSAYYAEGVLISGISFNAMDCAQGRTESLVSLLWCKKSTVQLCEFLKCRGPALSPAYGSELLVDNNYFNGTGPVAGMAVYVGETAGSRSKNTTIQNNTFEGNQGCVLVDAGDETLFQRNTIRGQTETALFALPTARGFKYLDNTIENVMGSKRKEDGTYDGASAGGMEIGGWGGTIRGNTIRNTQNGGIDIQSAGDLIVAENHIYMPGFPLDDRWPLPAAISYLSMAPLGSEVSTSALKTPRNIQICRNILDGSLRAGIRFWRQEGGPKVDTVFIQDNQGLRNGTQDWIDEGTKGLDFFVSRNLVYRGE